MKHIIKKSVVWVVIGFVFGVFALGCVPVKMPKDAYTSSKTLLEEVKKKHEGIESFRISGSIDHVSKQRIRGQVYLFSKLPSHLRIDVLSPFGNTLSVLTTDETKLGLSDYKTGKFFSGKPLPCNVAKFIGIALPPEDVVTILVGMSPIIKGTEEISWHKDGHYVVTIKKENVTQVLHIGADKETLPILRSILKHGDETIFDVRFTSYKMLDEYFVPYEIRIKMPKDKTELFVQYETEGVEFNVEFPNDAWIQTIPEGALLEPLVCQP